MDGNQAPSQGWDTSTLAGIALGLGLVTTAIALGPSRTTFWNFPSFMIVLGGVLATTLIRFPATVVIQSGRVLRQAFVCRLLPPVTLARDLVHMSERARRESLLAIERMPARDPFLRRGIALCADGVEPAYLEHNLRCEGATIQEHHERGQRVLRGMGASAPAFGMIGTLIGLVQMLTQLDDPGKIGSAMAVALLTTFYGALLAYLVFLPLADKLSERARQEQINREIVIQGLLSILAGHHPRLVEARLLGLLDPGVNRVSTLRRRRREAA